MHDRTPVRADEALEVFSPIETHLIRSEHVAQTYKIQVMLPLRRQGEKTRFPVVYVSDGNFAFDALKGISYSIQRSEHTAPRYIVVGIGYPDDSPLCGALLRLRDLTFPGYPRFSTKPPSIEGVLTAQDGTKDFYGGQDFQQFIERELVPFVDKIYPTVPDERIYFGHSAGAGFGLFTLFSEPQLFKNYIISSPGLIYTGETSAGIRYENNDFMLNYARKFIASGRRLIDTKVYMSIGAEEEFEPGVGQWKLTSSFHAMSALMTTAQVPGLSFVAEVFAGETHMTVWPMSFIHGVQIILGTRAWASKT